MIKKYPKSISENVIRKALYWLPRGSEWSLEESEGEWVISIKAGADNVTPEKIDRFVNDFILREKIDLQTGGLRRSIVVKALKDIERQINEP